DAQRSQRELRPSAGLVRLFAPVEQNGLKSIEHVVWNERIGVLRAVGRPRSRASPRCRRTLVLEHRAERLGLTGSGIGHPASSLTVDLWLARRPFIRGRPSYM